MFYFIKTPGWLKKLYGNCIWQMPASGKIIYLTFDDGPHPIATPFVLDTLKQYGALATFFCIGKNVLDQPAMYNRIINEGHGVGNHTFNHLNGWKTKDELYVEDITKACKYINSKLFRPPYGRATMRQLKQLTSNDHGFTPIMWTVLSGDFDIHLSPEKCVHHVIEKSESGSIIVFHDSEKAFERMSYALPKVLQHFTKQGYQFGKIESKKSENFIDIP